MDSSMDTDALLSMSLDALIAAKSKMKNRSAVYAPPGGGGGGGKIRPTGRAVRKQQTQPYTRDAAPRHSSVGPNSRVYVGNLAWDATWKELKDCMKQAGRVVKADVGVDVNGRSKVGGTPSRTENGAPLNRPDVHSL